MEQLLTHTGAFALGGALVWLYYNHWRFRRGARYRIVRGDGSVAFASANRVETVERWRRIRPKLRERFTFVDGDRLRGVKEHPGWYRGRFA